MRGLNDPGRMEYPRTVEQAKEAAKRIRLKEKAAYLGKNRMRLVRETSNDRRTDP